MDEQKNALAGDGTKLGYRVSRAEQAGACAIVLIHGLASNLTRWSEFTQYTSLKSEWNLLRIDLRGHGTSAYRGKYDRIIWCEDLRSVIEQENFSRVVIIGHSLGAQVAIRFAHLFPDKTLGLILIDPIFPNALRGSLGIAKKLRPLLWFLIRLVWLFNKLGWKRNNIPPRDLYELDKKTRHTLATDPHANIAKLYMSPWEDFKHIPTANYLQDLYEVTKPVTKQSNIQIPVLALLSAGASVTHRALIQKAIAEFPNHKTIIFDADHWLLTEKPKEARECIEQWCRETFTHLTHH